MINSKELLSGSGALLAARYNRRNSDEATSDSDVFKTINLDNSASKNYRTVILANAVLDIPEDLK